MPAEYGFIIIFGVRSPDLCHSKISSVDYITAAARGSPAAFEPQGLKSFIPAWEKIRSNRDINKQ